MRAVALVRDQIPPPPAGLDQTILGMIREQSAARGNERREHAAQRYRARSIMHPRLTAAATALTLAIVTTLVLLASGPSTRPSLAVANVPFTSQCLVQRDVNRDDEASQPRSLIVAGVWKGEEQARFERVLARFERMSGIPVTYAYETHDIAKTIKARVARGCPPDVAMLPQPGLLTDLAQRGHLQPMDASVRGLVRRNYDVEWRRRATVDGKLYGVWFKAANKSTLWYSRRAFMAAGVVPPSTWQELKQVAARLRAAGMAPFSVAGADGWTLTDWFENVYLATVGPAQYDRLARGKLAWTDPSVIAALRRLAEILARDDWLVGGGTGALKTDLVESVGQVFGRSQSAGMVYEGDFVASLIAQHPEAQADDVGLFAFPRFGEDRAPMVVGGDVAALFHDNPMGRELMRFLATPGAAEPWARAGGFISPNRSVGGAAYGDATTRRLARALVRAKTPRFDLSDLQPPAFGATDGQGMWKILQEYLKDADSVGAVTRKLQSAADAAGACERRVAGQC